MTAAAAPAVTATATATTATTATVTAITAAVLMTLFAACVAAWTTLLAPTLFARFCAAFLTGGGETATTALTMVFATGCTTFCTATAAGLTAAATALPTLEAAFFNEESEKPAVRTSVALSKEAGEVVSTAIPSARRADATEKELPVEVTGVFAANGARNKIMARNAACSWIRGRSVVVMSKTVSAGRALCNYCVVITPAIP
jgi:hypothetical protein